MKKEEHFEKKITLLKPTYITIVKSKNNQYFTTEERYTKPYRKTKKDFNFLLKKSLLYCNNEETNKHTQTTTCIKGKI